MVVSVQLVRFFLVLRFKPVFAANARKRLKGTEGEKGE